MTKATEQILPKSSFLLDLLSQNFHSWRFLGGYCWDLGTSESIARPYGKYDSAYIMSECQTFCVIQQRSNKMKLGSKTSSKENLTVLGNVTLKTLSGTAFEANSWQIDIIWFGYSAVGIDPRNVDTSEQGPSCSGRTRPSPTASSGIGGSHPWVVP
jgi:hypothetical protein